MMKRFGGVFLLAVCCISFSVLAQSPVEVKDDAPTEYTVQKGDTLWDISSRFLDKPWLWPELWRRNTQLIDPHLIFPGDILSIRYEDGVPVLVVARAKPHLELSPSSRVTHKAKPIPVLPWDYLSVMVNTLVVLDEDTYDALPKVLGNATGKARYGEGDALLTEVENRASEQLFVIRKYATIFNMDGDEIGVHVQHLANAYQHTQLPEANQIVELTESNREVQQGDRLMPAFERLNTDLSLQAAIHQTGFVVGDLHDYEILGLHDVVVIDNTEADVAPGTVMGIYHQGPTIENSDIPNYTDASRFTAFIKGRSLVEQPAMKVGELVVLKSFATASYGVITRANTGIKRGMIVAHP